jgi:hypothetical protein
LKDPKNDVCSEVESSALFSLARSSVLDLCVVPKMTCSKI